MLKIALTGGIACGKSLVSNLFENLGIEIIDTDKIAREIYHTKTVIDKLKKHFGEAIVDDNHQVSRRRLREVIFNHPEEKKWLEALLHPLIRNEVLAKISQVKSAYCIIVIPLLNESNRKHYPINRVLVVDAPEHLQLERLMARDNIKQDLAQKIISQQLSRKSRLQLADDIIVNEQDTAALETQISRLHRFYSSCE